MKVFTRLHFCNYLFLVLKILLENFTEKGLIFVSLSLEEIYKKVKYSLTPIIIVFVWSTFNMFHWFGMEGATMGFSIPASVCPSASEKQNYH